MTIAIAISLHDAVLLVADGRRMNSHGVVTDKARKIIALSSQAGLIVLGAEIGTDYATDKLKAMAGAGLSAEAFTEQLRRLARESQAFVVEKIIPDQRLTANIRVGLTMGGFDAEGSFVTAGLYGTGMEEPDAVIFRGNLGRVVLGGETVGAQDWFDARAQTVIGPLGMAARDPSVAIPKFKQIALETVDFAEKRDQSIGGRVMYALFKRGAAPEFGRF